MSQSVLYSQLFRQPSDEYFRAFFTTPVHKSALLSVFRANTHFTSLSESSIDSANVFTQVFTTAIKLLNFVTASPESVPKNSVEDDGDDITTLKSNHSVDVRPPDNSSLYSGLLDLDDDLRAQLVSNIVQIVQVWFENITTGPLCLLSTEFITADDLYSLLATLNWYLHQLLSDFAPGNPPNLVVVRDSIFMVYEVLTLLYKLASLNETMLKSLLFSFYRANLVKTFNVIFDITSVENDDGHFVPPQVSFSFETYVRLVVIVSSLSNIPRNFLVANKSSLSSDITAPSTESPNPYENWIVEQHFESLSDVNRVCCCRFLPVFCMNFNYFFTLKPDLFMTSISSSSFMHWVTRNRFSDNLYPSYDTVNTTTDISKNTLNISFVENDPFTKEVARIFDFKIASAKLSGPEDLLVVTSPEIFPLSLLLFSYTRNPLFLRLFLTQQYAVTQKIEDVSMKEQLQIELLEVWLCLTSYIFHYQYKSHINRYTCKLTLLILLRLTSPAAAIKNENAETLFVVDNLHKYQINEFKWKLCHHRAPVIPNNVTKDGFKSSLLYTLDSLQVLLRFNLTKKLSTENFRLAITIIFQILLKLKRDHDPSLGSYCWPELYRTVLNMLKFIKKHLPYISHTSLKCLIEETFTTLETLLDPTFNTIMQLTLENTSAGAHVLKPINYELVYEVLLNQEEVLGLFQEIITDRTKFPFLTKCLEFSKEEISETPLTDSDSPQLVEKLTNLLASFKLQEDMKGTYNYKDTMKFFGKPFDYEDFGSNHELFGMFNTLYEIKW